MRESGIVLDKLVLTTSSSYTPTGTGPDETTGTIGDLPPAATTTPATSITMDGATMNGGVTPNGLATDAWFEWGTDPTLATFSATSSQSLGSGTSSQTVNATLSGLSPGTTYYFRVGASNSAGTSKGAIVGFTTASGAAPDLFVQDGTGLVSMEAEHDQGNVPLGNYAWTPATNPGYSGSGALQALPDDDQSPLNAGAGPRLDYQVQFASTGTHYVWIRALANSNKSDSLYVGLDGGAAGAAAVTGLNVDGLTWKWTKSTQTSGIATINVTSPGLHTINVWMRESGIVLDKLVLTTSSSYTPTGTGPDETTDAEYIAVGDSITRGVRDDNSADGIGYEPVLGNLLTAKKGSAVTVANEGVSGTSSADGVASISSILSKYPSARYFLVMYGSNDAYDDATTEAVPSGMGLLPGNPGYADSYKDNMQRIISAILSAGRTPYLAQVPFTSDPLRNDAMIQEYNVVIDELVLTNNISVVPPDFYGYFQAHQAELADGLHPNGTGYQSMAELWSSVLP
jgi:lysophospholipase L1-like esterase